MIRSEYLLIVGGTFLIDCCEERKNALAAEWPVVVLAKCENLPVRRQRHCRITPCVRGKKCGSQ